MDKPGTSKEHRRIQRQGPPPSKIRIIHRINQLAKDSSPSNDILTAEQVMINLRDVVPASLDNAYVNLSRHGLKVGAPAERVLCKPRRACLPYELLYS